MSSHDAPNPEKSLPGNGTESPEENLAADLAEALRELPPDQRRMVASLIFSMERMPREPPTLLKAINSEHITQTLTNLDKESEREFQKIRSMEFTKRLGVGAILFLVFMVFFTGDGDLAEKVIIAAISGLGGFGIGFAIKQHNS